MMIFQLIIIMLVVITVLAVVDFVSFAVWQKRIMGKVIGIILDVLAVVVYPVLYIMFFDFGQDNDCCSDSAAFSPDHRLSFYVLIVLCIAVYFYCVFRKRTAPPLAELFVNIFLVTGIIFNILLLFHIAEWISVLANSTIILLFIMMLGKNHRMVMKQLAAIPEDAPKNALLKFLTAHPLIKFPVLLVASLPVLALLACVLLLFGQKPDSFVRAFTDTYKHGFSQLDYMCENVSCGGHFLCSVAAKGHPGIVKPERLGVRGGALIMCNRQLLVSNAFEELLEEKMPRLHRLIRRQYNKVGNMIYKHYGVFNRKGVADFVYVLMKPAEWIFLIVLYLSDRNPENRIARQYLDTDARNAIKKHG